LPYSSRLTVNSCGRVFPQLLVPVVEHVDGLGKGVTEFLAQALESGDDPVMQAVLVDYRPAADAIAALDVPGADELLMPARVGLKDPASVAADFAVFLASPRPVALTREVLALTGGLGTAVYF
jgi:hypothetical protein